MTIKYKRKSARFLVVLKRSHKYIERHFYLCMLYLSCLLPSFKIYNKNKNISQTELFPVMKSCNFIFKKTHCGMPWPSLESICRLDKKSKKKKLRGKRQNQLLSMQSWLHSIRNTVDYYRFSVEHIFFIVFLLNLPLVHFSSQAYIFE